MKINEVEALAGITKKNIRFYEEQGLLNPRRNSENGYRDYGEEEVQILQRIKMLRKLGVPIEEIRHILNGTHTVADGMRRHLITLEREQRNLEQSILLCREMQNLDMPIAALNTEDIMSKMEEMEKNGTFFQNKQTQDVRVRYVAPVIVTVVMVALMVGLSGLILWAYQISPEDAPPIWFLWLMIGMFAAVGAGVILALLQRIREIVKGEIDDARHY
ncbi:MAG: MerR family transcriptional regulator [Lachnospiraceae bacterium]|nr:MerR family transcriptional regulator [Lachnospiraceae bacterium]